MVSRYSWTSTPSPLHPLAVAAAWSSRALQEASTTLSNLYSAPSGGLFKEFTKISMRRCCYSAKPETLRVICLFPSRIQRSVPGWLNSVERNNFRRNAITIVVTNPDFCPGFRKFIGNPRVFLQFFLLFLFFESESTWIIIYSCRVGLPGRSSN